jgi:single-strand DNA-binding protein
MSSFNKIILMGNLTRDPVVSYLPSNTPVVDFGMATNRKWKSQDGQEREEVCFVDCRAFGRVADTIGKYCKKGGSILVEGRLTLDQWEKDGQKHSKHRVTVETFTFVGPAAGSAPQQPGEQANTAPVDDSDIPF